MKAFLFLLYDSGKIYTFLMENSLTLNILVVKLFEIIWKNIG